MISISMTTADSNGTVILADGTSELGAFKSRISRQATLDGGAVITHSGVSQSDRTFNIKTKINTGQKALLEYINFNSTLVMISCSEGFFLGSISSLDTSRPDIKMSILIKSKEA